MKLRVDYPYYLYFKQLEALEDVSAITHDTKYNELSLVYILCMERQVEHLPERQLVSELPVLFRIGEPKGHLKGKEIKHLGI